MAKADINPTGIEHCLEIYESEAESIHAFETTTSLLRADATTTTTVCTDIVKSNLKKKPNHKKRLKLTSEQKIVKPSFSAIFDSVQPKPWHLIKKRGIIPDGLVQTRLTHFSKLTNGSKGKGDVYRPELCSTNGKASKRKGGNLESPKAKQRRDINLEPKL